MARVNKAMCLIKIINKIQVLIGNQKIKTDVMLAQFYPTTNCVMTLVK